APAVPGADDVARVAERVAGQVGARDLGTLRGLLDAWPGPHGAAELLQVVERERDLTVTSFTAGEARVAEGAVTVPLQVALKWRRGGLVRVVGVKTDQSTARLEARLAREGGRWEVTGLRLASPFRK
ncbi:hypothetical protein, partial [Roseisolibacter sp. H3M3-2]|uniref:hypothetical protein n=1 Tax=Roseisolibacter sp. H3M3-2 TaxID=3031323 RepID=UPI0023DC80BB